MVNTQEKQNSVKPAPDAKNLKLNRKTAYQ